MDEQIEILIDKETMTKYLIEYDLEGTTAYIKQKKYDRFINGMLLEKPVIEKLVKLYKKNNKGDKKWEL